MRAFARGAIVLALLAAGECACAHAAHEWRAAWGAPYPLTLLEERAGEPDARGQDGCVDARGQDASGQDASHPDARRPGGRLAMRAAIAIARPYGVNGLTFHRVLVRLPGTRWEIHAGSLIAPAGYREWHLGCGRFLSLREDLHLMAGVRAFGAGLAGQNGRPELAATLLARFRPRGLALFAFEGGVVDAGRGNGESTPASLLLGRAVIDVRGATRLLVERSVSSRGAAETCFALAIKFDRMRLIQTFRSGTGEASGAVAWMFASLEFGFAQRWHPQLGWTSEITLRWLSRECAPGEAG
ncbi:MAG: hypothetical protein KBD56_03380 [Candidatus Eisenbacteria bacterium]|nr:hypothetical protein [Candidatus Eisenbacteria bacterium]